MTAPAFDSTFFPDFRGQSYARTAVHETLRSSRETAGDQALAFAGTNVLWSYALGWTTLTDAQIQAVLAAKQFMGDADALYFLEWRTAAASNVLLGTGTGSGALSFDLSAQVPGSDAVAAGLVVTRNGTPITASLATRTGANYVDHGVTIASGDNVAGAVYRASWTAARARRRVWTGGNKGAVKIGERRGGSGLWTASAMLLEEGASF